MQAWLISILRNAFYSEERSRRREVEDGDRIYAETLVVPAEQASPPECEELSEALGRLPDEMREAVLLIGAYGFSCREAASLCDCAVGRIKSRVNRARTRLAELMSIESVDDFGPDRATRAVLGGNEPR